MTFCRGAIQQVAAREPNQRASQRRLARIAVACGRVNSTVRWLSIQSMANLSNLEAIVQRVVTMLADADYDGIVRLTNGRRLTAFEIASAVSKYGRKIVTPPPNAWKRLDVIEVAQAQPQEWNVRFNLWTVEEGESDLTLDLTVRETQNAHCDVEFNDLHVL